MMKKLGAPLVIFYFVVIGCVNNKSEKIERIESEFKNCLETLHQSSDIQAPIYFIIPRAGCNGCISSAEAFMVSSLGDSDSNKDLIRFVLTDFDSEKTIRARFGNVFSNTMVIVDKENIFKSNLSLKSIYPVILFFDHEHRLQRVSEVSPNRDGLSETQRYIADWRKKT